MAAGSDDVGGPVGALRRLPRRAVDAVESRFFPEAEGAADHWQRKVMYESVNAHLDALDVVGLTCVEIAGANHAGRSWKEFRNLDYPAFDLCAPVLEENRGAYDVVICEQVLEHVEAPWAAAANLRELCAPGGEVIVSTPFMIRVHELPYFGLRDYWRFTPRGLRTLLEAGGLEVESVESWGNRECVVGNMRVWSAHRPWHSLRNEPDIPLQVWAFARRP